MNLKLRMWKVGGWALLSVGGKGVWMRDWGGREVNKFLGNKQPGWEGGGVP